MSLRSNVCRLNEFALPVGIITILLFRRLSAMAIFTWIKPPSFIIASRILLMLAASAVPDRKSVVQGKSVDLGGRRIIKKKHHPPDPRTRLRLALMLSLLRSRGHLPWR